VTEHDPLELELAALRPREPSAALKRRIADALVVPAPTHVKLRPTAWRRASVAGGLLAASLLAVTVWRGDMRIAQVNPTLEAIDRDLIFALDSSLPSVWSYQQALNRSTEVFDGLLDAHSRRTFPTKEDALPVMRLAIVTANVPWMNQGEL
jgi:hypothetical protein